MNIVILGSGNIATHFAHNFYNKGHKIVQIFSQQKVNAQALAFVVNAEAINQISAINPDADLYIIAISDQAILAIIEKLPDTLNGIVIHCSGATDIQVLNKFKRYGIIYPPQSISKNQDSDFSLIPFCIEGDNSITFNILFNLIQEIAPKSIACTSYQRLAIHVASVFSNNFANALFQISYDLLFQNDLPFDLIRPIILETALKVQSKLPKDVQTGPAIRNDEITIKKHLDFISDQENWKQIYQLLSQEIVKRKN
ncbi:DUF2520 domain-containing protein [Sphingobacterium sp. SRCM116780]|uniref:Rossmann-like and DUF2520 domain-containing protein n=1 Tax=Sphingobacterium sp. SRCM116780 TaxID=2907623 RepID=UPI001F3AC9DD|nr:Rossmann-like and DUF2520 domain-containing protein [Sphingobacterium sp. SRCM116780]UIR56292.1 DUF2520 domain-containing protein [Sphingobacterium sp. SRCM116780]